MAIPADSSEIATWVVKELEDSRFACSSLKPLNGGTANYIFKGRLTTPLADGTEDILIKHGEGYVALNPSFQLTTSRCRFEEVCMEAAQRLPPLLHENVAVRMPKIFSFNPETNTQLQEFLPSSANLKSYSLRHFAFHNEASEDSCRAIGFSLGSWLRSFHEWTEQRPQAKLKEEIKKNKPMQILKNAINYGALVQQTEKRPILADAKPIFEQVRAMAQSELEEEENLQVIHGDFWTGNVLLPDKPLPADEQTQVFIIDWELCQLGVRPLDLGQMVAEMYELKLFKDIEAGIWLIEGFAAGYGPVDDAFAYRTAIHVGTHLLCFSGVPGWGTPEQADSVRFEGKDLVVRAWSQDRAWFDKHPLSCLFSQT